jgi:hypothetical protein
MIHRAGMLARVNRVLGVLLVAFVPACRAGPAPETPPASSPGPTVDVASSVQPAPVDGPIGVPKNLSDGSVGCFGWSAGKQVYACADVVFWPGDRCVAIDLLGRDKPRSVPVAGGSRCGSGPRKDAAEVVADLGTLTAVREVELKRDRPVEAAGATLILKLGYFWQLAVRCPGGGEAVALERMPGRFGERYVFAWAPGAPFATVASFSHTAMEPGAPVRAVETAVIDVARACAPSAPGSTRGAK